ncbi:divisome protein SepX/GlpR [Goodfellowiella coeruleoviolacea]|uniref:Uncharacterized protein n=1 Tax=Goodfellowiella coeruleoviolacea TaxID=334858 RepID=A0AAE3GMJ7_9PSEU|nr:gephyrin-like molybdotransferase receptor GlpR [Goodfellowiella coeruleoviolacea]MCP2168718.1 hypothetical protein [Goodfellowiella coeruleoviolacea]
MPSSLIIVALVVAWLVVLVPMVARKRQEVARTADSALAARVVRSGSTSRGEEEFAMAGTDNTDPELTPEDPPTRTRPSDQHGGFAADDEFDDDYDQDYDEGVDADGVDDTDETDEPEDYPANAPREARPYRPGRGGFDPESAARQARAKYAFRQRVVLLMLLLAVASAVTAALVSPLLWWAHGVIDLILVSYLVYLRRQVRIEAEIRERRAARLAAAGRQRPTPQPVDRDQPDQPPTRRVAPVDHRPVRPNAVVVDREDEDPIFDELEAHVTRPYRRVVGE